MIVQAFIQPVKLGSLDGPVVARVEIDGEVAIFRRQIADVDTAIDLLQTYVDQNPLPGAVQLVTVTYRSK